MGEAIKKYFQGDKVIWGMIFLLSVFSLLAVYSSTGTLAYRKMGGNTLYYLFRHGVILGVGLTIIFVVHMIPYRFYFQLSRLFLWLSGFLLVFTLISGTRMNEATRWLTLPGLGFTFQPSDFAKMSLVMYLARVLSMRQQQVMKMKEVMRSMALPVFVISALILPANLSTALIIFIVSLILMFVGRVRIPILLSMIGIAVLFGGMFLGIAMLAKHEGRIYTWKNRIEHFIQGDDTEDYQVEQAKIAVATGGIFGKKPGKSTQRNFLPHPYSDFIFAIIVEEYGLIFGAIPILLAYLILLYRAGLIVKKSSRTFPAFLAIGLTLLIVMQAFVNMGVSVTLFPVTGQTLPLVSMGGSSMLFTSIELGIILNISRNLDNQQTEVTDEQTVESDY
ncbi:MAG: FtsW/RodA/SpoVE family cell cycle protein [Bacteroidales bacterium]|nr:FtsW/RodA/SpoVE family cell cycle protein [Bacteroidales bacterium]